MLKRGRPSGADLALVPVTPLGAVPRQKPPSDLTDEEVEVWSAIVSNEPADHFSPSTAPLLAQFCRHTVSAKRVGELIERDSAQLDLAEYDKLLAMQARESASLAMLAVKMRIAQQSTINQRGNKHTKTAQARKLWDG